MQLMTLVCALLAASQLTGCDSSSRESQPIEAARSSPARPTNPDLLSIDGELFPLSTYFGVCIRNKGVWRATLHNIPVGAHYPTDGEITVAGGVKLSIAVGKLGVYPGTVLKDVPTTSPPRRIQIGHDRGQTLVLVSGFVGAGNNLVSINHDEKDTEAEAEAMHLANNVVACHISAVPINAKGAIQGH